jgi:hypothetical protein
MAIKCKVGRPVQRRAIAAIIRKNGFARYACGSLTNVSGIAWDHVWKTNTGNVVAQPSSGLRWIIEIASHTVILTAMPSCNACCVAGQERIWWNSMLIKKLLSVFTYFNGFWALLAFMSIVSLLLVHFKIVSKNQPLVGLFIVFSPPITFILLWCFLISSIILVFVFLGFLSVRWPQLSSLFWLNSLCVVYSVVHFYFVGFVIPKLSP